MCLTLSGGTSKWGIFSVCQSPLLTGVLIGGALKNLNLRIFFWSLVRCPTTATAS